MQKDLSLSEFIVTRLIKACGYSAILFVALIFYFLLREGLPTLAEVDLGNLFSSRWYPVESYYGVLPLISGSLIVTLGAALVAIPLGWGRRFSSPKLPRVGRVKFLNRWWNCSAGCPRSCLAFWDPGSLSQPADFAGPANRADRPGRVTPAGRNLHPDGGFRRRRCPRLRPALVP